MVGQLLSQLLSHLFLPPAVALLQLAPLALFPLQAFLAQIAQFALLSLLPARSLMLLFNMPSCLSLIQCAARSGFAVIAASYISLIKPYVVICVSAAFAIALHTFAMVLPLTPAWAFTIICRRTAAPPSPCIIWVLWSACALIVTPNFSPARLLTAVTEAPFVFRFLKFPLMCIRSFVLGLLWVKFVCITWRWRWHIPGIRI